jgi:hypothetical protein
MIGIDPRNMEVMEWTDKMTPFLNTYGDVGKLEGPENWQNWAVGVILINQQWQSVAPNPYQYVDWREWAERFLQVIP